MPKTYTFTEHASVCRWCHERFNVAREVIQEVRENDPPAYQSLTDKEVAESLDVCLECNGEGQNPGEKPEKEAERARLIAALQNAVDAFWNSVAESYPEVTTGDLSPFSDLAFQDECESVIEAWLSANKPTDAEEA